MSVTVNNRYLESLLAGQPQLPASLLRGLNRLRSDAVDRVGALTVPTTRDEEWRFTDISPLTRMPFQPVRGTPHLSLRISMVLFCPKPRAMVFVDGVYAPQLLSTGPVSWSRTLRQA